MQYAFKLFCQPYLPLMLLLGAALLHARRRGRLAGQTFGVIVFSWLMLIILSIPLVGHLLMGTLEWRFFPVPELPENPDAIIVIGGGLIPESTSSPFADLNTSSYKRVLHAWRLYRRFGGCPVILCGGATSYGDSRSNEAGVMGDFLVRLGIPEKDLILEVRSRTTYENAVHSAEILKNHKWNRPILVTEAHHMLRAMRSFREQGIQASPAPCGFQAERLDGPPYDWLIPKAGILERCQAVLTEWAGMAYYRILGRI